MKRKPIYEFSEWWVKELGEAVGKAKQEGAIRSLTDEEVKKVLQTTFNILGKYAKISLHTVNVQLGKQK